MLLLQMQKEILLFYRPKRRNWFCDKITHFFLCTENTGDYKKGEKGGKGKEKREEGGTKLK